MKQKIYNVFFDEIEEPRFVLFRIVLALLFFSIGFNFYSYPLLAIGAIISCYCFYKENVHKKTKIIPWIVFLPMLLALYTAISPGHLIKDLPVGDKMLASYLIGLGAIFFIPKTYSRSLLALPVALSVSFIPFLLSGFSNNYFQGDRLILFIGHPNKLAFVVVASIIITVAFWKDFTSINRFVPKITTLLCIISLIMSSSRASIVACFVCLLFWTSTILTKHILKIIIVTIAVTSCALFILAKPGQDKMNDIYERVFDSLSMQHRFLIWHIAWDGFKKSPWFGNSVRGYKAYYTNFVNENEEFVNNNYPGFGIGTDHPHSIYFGLPFMYGLIGLPLFLWSFGPALRISVKKRDCYFLSVIIFYLVTGLFEFTIHRVSGSLFLFFPLGLVYGRVLTDSMKLDVED